MPKDIAYYLHLDDPQQIARLQHRFHGLGIVYGICNLVNQMIYIGTTMNPGLRFHKHFLSKEVENADTRERSNSHLQEAISKYGLSRFKVLVFEVVPFPADSTYSDKQKLLRDAEQRYMDHFPKVQMYNKYRATK
jgi:group I intron endonuclease